MATTSRASEVRARVAAQLPHPGRATGAWLLSWVAAALALGAALTGLVVGGAYPGARSTAEMFRGYDLVTAAVVVPTLAVATLRARRGSLVAQLVVAGLLADLVYTYPVLLFGTRLNDVFLLHLAVFATALAGLVLVLADADVPAVTARFRDRTRRGVVVAVLGLLAISLGLLWTWAVIDHAVSGQVLQGSRLVETDAVVRLGIALDLALLVPLYAAAAVLVWRRRGLGYLLAAVALVSGIAEQLNYLVAMPFQAAADIPGAVWTDPLEPVVLALYLLGAVALWLGGRRGPRREPHRGPPGAERSVGRLPR